LSLTPSWGRFACYNWGYWLYIGLQDYGLTRLPSLPTAITPDITLVPKALERFSERKY